MLRILRNVLINAILAGIFIGIGGTVYLSCETKFVGAVFFSIALLSICMMDLYLFTGKIGYITDKFKKSEIASVLTGLVGNGIGTFLAGLVIRYIRPELIEKSAAMCEAKAQQSFLQIFISGIMCGILMYTAVQIYKTKNTSQGIFFCVPVFILCGFEHSIADMFYFFLAGRSFLTTMLFIAIVALGNTLGGISVPCMKRLCKGEKECKKQE